MKVFEVIEENVEFEDYRDQIRSIVGQPTDDEQEDRIKQAFDAGLEVNIKVK